MNSQGVFTIKIPNIYDRSTTQSWLLHDQNGIFSPLWNSTDFLCVLLSSFLGETSLNFEHRMNEQHGAE